jgi:hypothetical protein
MKKKFSSYIRAGETTKYISIRLSDEEYTQVSKAKGDRTWREYIMKDVLNQLRREELLAVIQNGKR